MQVAPEKIICYIKPFTLPKSKELLIRNLSFYLKLYDSLLALDTPFSRYQSFAELGIDGWRNTEARIVSYRLRDFLTKDLEVLDIGCNIGFLDLQIAPYVKSVLGIDYNAGLIGIASDTANYLGIDNAKFSQIDFINETVKGTYDVVLFCAACGFFLRELPMDEIVNRVIRLLKPDGYLVFESQGLKRHMNDYVEMKQQFIDSGLSVCWEGNHYSGYERRFIVLKKCGG